MKMIHSCSDEVMYALNCEEGLNDLELNTYEEGVCSEDKDIWLEAMNIELASLHKNETWIFVDKPVGQKLVDCQMDF